jgi:hypothetical protein
MRPDKYLFIAMLKFIANVKQNLVAIVSMDAKRYILKKQPKYHFHIFWEKYEKLFEIY